MAAKTFSKTAPILLLLTSTLPALAGGQYTVLHHRGRIPHQRPGAFFGEPVGGEVVAVGGVEEALVEEVDEGRSPRRA
jgi:hypothetical protein